MSALNASYQADLITSSRSPSEEPAQHRRPSVCMLRGMPSRQPEHTQDTGTMLLNSSRATGWQACAQGVPQLFRAALAGGRKAESTSHKLGAACENVTVPCGCFSSRPCTPCSPADRRSVVPKITSIPTSPNRNWLGMSERSHFTTWLTFNALCRVRRPLHMCCLLICISGPAGSGNCAGSCDRPGSVAILTIKMPHHALCRCSFVDVDKADPEDLPLEQRSECWPHRSDGMNILQS